MRELRSGEARGCTRDVGPGVGELRVRHRDEMGSPFGLVSVLFLLDGRLVYLWNAGAKPPPARPPEATAAPGPASLDHAPVEQTASSEAEEGGGKAARMEPRQEPVAFDVPVSPGFHMLQARVVYRGQGSGAFSYLESYRFNVLAAHSFTAVPGALSEITMLNYAKGGLTTPLEERPAMRWIGP
jgi:hypothetical protein